MFKVMRYRFLDKRVLLLSLVTGLFILIYFKAQKLPTQETCECYTQHYLVNGNNTNACRTDSQHNITVLNLTATPPPENVHVNKAWLAKRKALLSVGHMRKVYFFAHMRGGSSIGGMLFDTDPQAVLWFEPMDQFFMAYYGLAGMSLPMEYMFHKNHTRRNIPKQEHKLYVDYISNLLNCNYERLPADAFAHTDFLRESTAMKPMLRCIGITTLGTCKKIIGDTCGTRAGHHRDILKAEKNKCLENIEFFSKLKHSSSEVRSGEYRTNVFYKYSQCMSSVEAKIQRCLPHATKICRKAKIQALEVLRSNMETLEAVILKNPDIYVVYYVRDPRAIANSVIHTDLTTPSGKKDLYAEAEYLCRKMEEDYKVYTILNKKYPGVFLLTSYEKLATDPVGFGNRIYQHIGLGNAPKQWITFSKDAMHSRVSTGTFGVKRKNGTASIARWRKGLSSKYLQRVNELCYNVLKLLNYSF